MAGNPAVGRIDPPLPPTGQTITLTEMYFFTIKDGKIVSFAAERDTAGMLRQLGRTFTPPG